MQSFGRIFVVLFLVSLCVVLLFSLLAFLPSAPGPVNRAREFTLIDSVQSESTFSPSKNVAVTSDPTSLTETPTDPTAIAVVVTASPPASRGVTLPSTPLFDPQFPPTSTELAKMTSSCASLFSRTAPQTNIAFVINARDGVRFVPSASTASSSLLHVATCPIDKVTPGTRRVHATTASNNIMTTANAASVCKTVLDVALVGDLYRPQHTMQFLFALMGVVALQSEFNLYQAQVPVFVNVMKYGAVGSAKEFCRRKFAHFELLDLLGPVTPTSSSPSIFLFRDAEWKQYSVPAPSLSSQISGKYPIAATCFSEKEEKTVLFIDDNNSNSNNQTNNIEDNICVKKIIWGSIPVRIPGTKIKTDSNLKPKYFQDFRARIIQRWLKPQKKIAGGNGDEEGASSYSGHILLVRREKENGRFLHQDMKIATIVKEALEYLDSNNNNNDNENGESTSKQQQQQQQMKKEKIKIVPVEWEKMKLRDQLRMVVNARAMIGVHGNGLTWACFMREGSFIIEFSSSIRKKNEVFEGINIANAGNIAPACGMKSLSLRAPWVESEKTSKEGTFSPHHKWKLVDIEPGEREFKAVETFVKSNGVVFS